MDDFFKSDSGVQERSNKGPTDEVLKNWGRLVFQIYERMVHHSDVNFFISAPQIISNLAFIVGVVGYENAPGIMASYWGIRVDEAKRRIQEIIDAAKESNERKEEKKKDEGPYEATLRLVHAWSGEFKALIGQYHRARRLYVHPKYVNPHNYLTFQCFRKFRVDEKIFEGIEEVNDWLMKSLKIDFPEKQRLLTMWAPEEKPDERQERLKQRQAMEEECSGRTFELLTADRQRSRSEEVVVPKTPKIGPQEMEKRAPVMVWTSHAVLEMPSDIFDAEVVYTWDGGEYLRIRQPGGERIPVEESDFAFNLALIPTQNPQLRLLLIYNLDSSLCTLEKLERFMAEVKAREEMDREAERRSRAARDTVVQEARITALIVRKVGVKNEKEKSAIYMPNWKIKDFPPSRIAHHLASTINMSSIFVEGGFGDLAPDETIPSASGDRKAVSHIQHVGLLTISNAPDTLKQKIIKEKSKEKKSKSSSTISVRKSINETNAESIEIIPFPVLVMLWDLNRGLPVYLGKVNGESSGEDFDEMEKEKAMDEPLLSCTNSTKLELGRVIDELLLLFCQNTLDLVITMVVSMVLIPIRFIVDAQINKFIMTGLVGMWGFLSLGFAVLYFLAAPLWISQLHVYLLFLTSVMIYLYIHEFYLPSSPPPPSTILRLLRTLLYVFTIYFLLFIPITPINIFCLICQYLALFFFDVAFLVYHNHIVEHWKRGELVATWHKGKDSGKCCGVRVDV